MFAPALLESEGRKRSLRSQRSTCTAAQFLAKYLERSRERMFLRSAEQRSMLRARCRIEPTRRCAEMRKHSARSAKRRSRAGEWPREGSPEKHRDSSTDSAPGANQPCFAHCRGEETAKVMPQQQSGARGERIFRNPTLREKKTNCAPQAPDLSKRGREQGALQ